MSYKDKEKNKEYKKQYDLKNKIKLAKQKREWYLKHSTHVKQRLNISIQQRFEKFFIKSEGCWLWLGSKDPYYGLFTFNGKMEKAHRISFILYKGIIPKGMLVCHNCPSGDNPACVNPNHLWLGNHLQNRNDMINKIEIIILEAKNIPELK